MGKGFDQEPHRYTNIRTDTSVLPPRFRTDIHSLCLQTDLHPLVTDNTIINQSEIDHKTKSKTAMQTTAEIALRKARKKAPHAPTKALLLGTSDFSDIPITWLAENFDHVTAVDINNGNVSQAVSALDPDLQSKIQIVIADISGVAGEITGKLQDAQTGSHSFDFFSKAVDVFETTDVTNKTPDLGNDYTFVSSQLLMSQLLNIPVMYYQHLLEQYANQMVTSRGEFLLRLSDRLHKEHLRYLARLVTPHGSVHFADTYTSTALSSFSHQPQRFDMLDGQSVNDEIDELFDHVSPFISWEWMYDDTETYTVGSHSLQLKGAPTT